MRPGRHCAGVGTWRGENMELWNLAASGELAFALQAAIFFQPLISLTLPRFGTTAPTVSAPRLHTKQCVHQKNLHCWSDWSFTCCKTVEDPYCPFTVLLAIAIQCFALFMCFQIMHKIWKFCMKFGHLILEKIFTFVAREILRLKCTKFNFGWGFAPDPADAEGAYSALSNLLAGCKGPTSKGGKGVGRGGEWESKRRRNEKGGNRRGPRMVGSHPLFEFLKKYPDAELIWLVEAATEIFTLDGKQVTTSRRHCTIYRLSRL